MKELIWFNILVLYSAICAGFAVESAAGSKRLVLVFLAVHGALWAVYRAVGLLRNEHAVKGGSDG